MNISNMSIKSKLFATLGLLAAIMCIVGIIGFFGMRQTNNHLDGMFNGRLVPASWVDEVITLERKGIESIELATIKQDPASVSEAVDAVKGSADKIKDTWAKLDKLQVNETQDKIIDKFGTNLQAILEINTNAVAALQAGGGYDKAEKAMLEQARPKYDQMTAIVDELKKAQIESAQASWEQARAEFRNENILMVTAILVGLGLAAFLGMLLVRSIMNALNVAVGVANRIASGHVGNHIDITTNDELGELLKSLRTMDGKLVEIVGSVRTTASSVGSAASELSQGNDDLSSRTRNKLQRWKKQLPVWNR